MEGQRSAAATSPLEEVGLATCVFHSHWCQFVASFKGRPPAAAAFLTLFSFVSLFPAVCLCV